MKSEPRVSVPFTSALHRRAAILAVVALATSGAAGASPAAAPPSDHAKPVVVTASRVVPHVESTYPVAGARVAPGLMVLRVTYDTRMRADGWSYAEESGTEYPDCAKSPRLLDDGRSFVLICRTLPAKRYAVWFNRPPLVDFASISRRAAAPYELKFATSDDDPVRTLPDAIKADPALSRVSNPVEPDGQAVYGDHPDTPGVP